MEFGLLWHDGDASRPLEEKIGRAARRYREKYGREPNTCYVHAGAGEDQPQPGSHRTCRLKDPRTAVRVVWASNIPLHHFWLGESRKGSTADMVNSVD
jgi:hypothetical protein